MTADQHILVVEDSELVTGAMTILLESAGYRVSIAPTLADATHSAHVDPASLVLLDLTLPDGNGLSIVDDLRAAGCQRIVALTGHDDAETKARCLAAGCSDVAVKPVPARELIRRAAAWLSED